MPALSSSLAAATADAGAPVGSSHVPHIRVFLRWLRVTDFRNYTSLSLELDGRPVVLSGANGAGKTNLLEAVSLLAPGRGLRRVPFADLANALGSGLWAVAGQVQAGDALVNIGTGLALPAGEAARKAGRVVKVDGETRRSSASLGEYVTVVWLTPALDGLFTGSGADRRRFFDRLIAGLDPQYRHSLSRFERAMRQRNKLLELGGAAAHFEALEAEMAAAGVAVAAARVQAVERLERAIAAKWQRGDSATAFPWARLEVSGRLEADTLCMPALEAEDAYRRRLAEGRAQDQAARRALEGPHRSDFLAFHGPKSMPARLSSTGEQKALLVGLILAYGELVQEMRAGHPPILLLDEIAAHLDEHRRTALFEELLRQGVQAFMTGTDAEVFAPFGSGAQYFHIREGRLAA